MSPLVGSSILELGNKIKMGVTYKSVFESMGFRHISVDTNGRDGALPLDLRKPLNLGTFDMVTNLGTTEHVSEDDYAGQVQCWRNVVEAMHVGSVLVSITPMPGSNPNHGVWYPHKQFFRELARLNGMEVERLYDSDQQPDGSRPGHQCNNARLIRRELVPFAMPEAGMYRNQR